MVGKQNVTDVREAAKIVLLLSGQATIFLRLPLGILNIICLLDISLQSAAGIRGVN